MAQPPKLIRLTIDQSQEPGDQIQQMVMQLNSNLSDVHALFNGGITSQNLQQQQFTLNVSTDGTGKLAGTTAFKCSLPVRPTHITHGQIRTLSGPAPTAAVDVSQWLVSTDNTVTFSAIPGLGNSGRYAISLIIQ